MLSINWGQAGNVVFSGFFIVFITLVLLIMFVYLMGWILKQKNTPKVNDAPSPAAPPSPKISAPAAPPADSLPSSQGETVAVISAAVAAYMADAAPGVSYVVTGITPSGVQPSRAGRSKELRPVWGFAGMRQNTEPF